MSCTRRTRSASSPSRAARCRGRTSPSRCRTTPSRPSPAAPTRAIPSGAAFLRAMREGSARNGIRVFDLGDPEQGISHVVAPEVGMVLPGATHAVPDSHASTVGGLGAHGVRLRHHRAGAHPRHAGDRDEAAEVDAHPPRRHAGAARHRQGRGAEDHRRARHGRRPRARGRVCRLGGARDGDGRPHDALQSQYRDGRPLGLRGAGRRHLQLDRGPAVCAAGRAMGSGARALAHAQERRRRQVRHRARDRLRGARAADHLGHRSEPGGRHLRPRARSGVRSEPRARSSKARSPIWG